MVEKVGFSEIDANTDGHTKQSERKINRTGIGEDVSLSSFHISSTDEGEGKNARQLSFSPPQSALLCVARLIAMNASGSIGVDSFGAGLTKWEIVFESWHTCSIMFSLLQGELLFSDLRTKKSNDMIYSFLIELDGE